MEHEKLTVLSRVSNGGFGLRAFSHLINSLHFNVKGREVAHICDDKGWRLDGFDVPGRSVAQNFPPHHFIFKTWAVETMSVHFLQKIQIRF